MKSKQSIVAKMLQSKNSEILKNWLEIVLSKTSLRTDLISKSQMQEESRELFELFSNAIQENEGDDIDKIEFKELLSFLTELSSARAKLGFLPAETSNYIFSLKDIIVSYLQDLIGNKDAALKKEILNVTRLLDKIALFTFEKYSESREKIIIRQQEEMLDISTPVLQVWNGILALPLIGTLDSMRTQVVMQNLLNAINQTGYSIAILDISGVSVVDTLVAQHLIKTVNAARMMGAECIISGIRPEIAQTIVGLGIDLSSIKTKATLAAALKESFNILKIKVEENR